MPAVEAPTPPPGLDKGAEGLHSPAPKALQGPAPDLTRLLMRHTLPLVLGFLALALLLGVLAAQREEAEDVDAALATARLSRYLGHLPQLSDEQALAVLRQSSELRHLDLRITDSLGRTRLGTEPAVSATERAVSWTVARPQGGPHSGPDTVPQSTSNTGPWTVTLVASPRSEWTQLLSAGLPLLLVFGLGGAAWLALMRWNLRRSLVAPLQSLLAATAALQKQDPRPLHRLHPLPPRELEQMATDLRALWAALAQAEQARRSLGAQVQTLQEDERQRLAQDLNEHFGQRLTALRVDLTWLRRRLLDDRQLEPVLSGMQAQLAQVQQGLRGLLTRLNPLSLEGADADTLDPPGRLHDLLLQLTEDWSGAEGSRCICTLEFKLDSPPLPRPLLLAVYRMSQEALSNVARHAHASQVRLTVSHTAARTTDHGPGTLHWSVEDDGRGMADLDSARRRGQGLNGLRERARAFGGDLQAGPGTQGRGLRLSTQLPMALD